ncbi:MAG: beta-Ala-His dipeptidase, partial [Bacteroidota bacterium]
TNFDFDSEGIKMIVDGDWVKADGTTLGADNGLGVAAIMAILESNELKHPPIEALFTIDEETGMTGAMHLKGGLLDAEIMLNLDTEDDHELTIGCAGGIDITASGIYMEVPTKSESLSFKIALTGLNGGHSGMDIHKGLGNANKLMNRLLYGLNEVMEFQLHDLNGGSLRNAIPRESFASISFSVQNEDQFNTYIKAFSEKVKLEYNSTDEELSIEAESIATPSKALDAIFLGKLIRSIYACPNGIYRMSPDIDDLVQTSNNLAKVSVGNSKYEILCLTRSSVDSEKMDEANAIRSCFELMGADVELSGSYPGWTPKPNARIVTTMTDLYKSMFQGEPDVNACHAGLECGILGTNYPEMEMISFGPNIRGAHSPDEKTQISSVQKFWKFLVATLENIK